SCKLGSRGHHTPKARICRGRSAPPAGRCGSGAACALSGLLLSGLSAFSLLYTVPWGNLLSDRTNSGLRHNDKVIVPGAQTERPGDAGPVRLLLGGGDSPPISCGRRCNLRPAEDSRPPKEDNGSAPGGQQRILPWSPFL